MAWNDYGKGKEINTFKKGNYFVYSTKVKAYNTNGFLRKKPRKETYDYKKKIEPIKLRLGKKQKKLVCLITRRRVLFACTC